jgi:putative transcriptional regulator
MKANKPVSRLSAALLETADDMASAGLLTAEEHKKITLRHLPEDAPNDLKLLTGPEIREIRERSNMSQAVFARYLRVTTGYVSQLERGAKKPAGPALVLLNVIRKRGIEMIL